MISRMRGQLGCSIVVFLGLCQRTCVQPLHHISTVLSQLPNMTWHAVRINNLSELELVEGAIQTCLIKLRMLSPELPDPTQNKVGTTLCPKHDKPRNPNASNEAPQLRLGGVATILNLDSLKQAASPHLLMVWRNLILLFSISEVAGL